jgi:hypothetical protein
MNLPNHNVERCRSLISELPWNERSAFQSARIAVSKAVWLGVERDEVLSLVRTVPSASFLRQCPHILTETWETMTQANQLGQFMSEFDQLLDGDVETDFGMESLAYNSFPTLTQANRKTATARRHYRSSGKLC